MKYLRSLLPLFVAASYAIGAPASTPLTTAVFDFESKEESIKDLGPKVSALVNALLSAEADLVMVERAELEKVLGEQELGLSGSVNAASAAKIGQLTGARVLVTGKVMKADKELLVVAKVIGTETSRVYAEIAKAAASSPLTEIAGELAKKIASVLASKGDTLVAKPQAREDYLSKLKATLEGAEKPSLSIHLPEMHYGTPVNDPAAETELTLLARQSGFEVLDASATTKPKVQITGEAFSAFGLRKGNLVSCKARVELKAVDVATGRIITADRETTVTLDISEQTAAKTALQKAASELAVRLLPKVAGK